MFFLNGINDKSNDSVCQEFKVFEMLELNQNSFLQMWKFEIAWSCHERLDLDSVDITRE